MEELIPKEFRGDSILGPQDDLESTEDQIMEPGEKLEVRKNQPENKTVTPEATSRSNIMRAIDDTERKADAVQQNDQIFS